MLGPQLGILFGLTLGGWIAQHHGWRAAFIWMSVPGVLAALLLKSTVFKGEAVPFVMELPNYRLPGLKNVAQLLWEKARDFLQKAFTVIFAATIVIWFLQNFDLQLSLTAYPQDSILARIAGDIAPLFAPLGFADWRISTALISGFMAKESVVSSLLILFGSGLFVGNFLGAKAADRSLTKALVWILEKYSPDHMASGLKYLAGKLDQVTVVRIDVDYLSGKARRA